MYIYNKNYFKDNEEKITYNNVYNLKEKLIHHLYSDKMSPKEIKDLL